MDGLDYWYGVDGGTLGGWPFYMNYKGYAEFYGEGLVDVGASLVMSYK